MVVIVVAVVVNVNVDVGIGRALVAGLRAQTTTSLEIKRLAILAGASRERNIAQ